MIYELINQSDPITFKAESDKVAFFCALVLGSGKAGMRREDCEVCESPMVFLSSDPMRGIEEFLGCEFQAFADNNVPEISACFRSFAYGNFSDRANYDSAIEAITDPEKLAAFKAKHEDQNRSSMSKWVAGAWRYADAYDKRLKEIEVISE